MVKRIEFLYIDETGRLIADVEGGRSIVIGLVGSFASRPFGGYRPTGEVSPNDSLEVLQPVVTVNNDGKISRDQIPDKVATVNEGGNWGLLAALSDAGSRLRYTQNNDGGWEWMNPDTDPDTGTSGTNTLGVTAQGLLEAYKQLRKRRYLKACIATYDAMVVNSQDPNPSKHRIRGPDIPFLVELSEVVGSSTYADFAKARWASAMTEFGSGTASGFAEYIRDVRKGQNLPAAIPWDIDLYIQGVLALHRYFPNEGFHTQATDMVEVIYNSLYVEPVDFDLTNEAENEFWIGVTGAIRAFVTTETHPTEAAELVTRLVTSQADDGHFIGVDDGSDVQTTAYAVISLLEAGERAAASKGVDYLGDNQLDEGGWKYDGGENTEVTSEAAQAIYDLLTV